LIKNVTQRAKVEDSGEFCAYESFVQNFAPVKDFIEMVFVEVISSVLENRWLYNLLA